MSITTRSDGKLGLSVLQESPLDCDKDSWKANPAEKDAGVQHWVSSRYTIRATAEDGRLILWNSLSGSMSVFKAEQEQQVRALLKGKGVESRKEGLVGYLVDRGFLVQKGSNDYRRFLHAFGKQHYRNDRLELILMSSEDCNFRCKYCYEDFARGTMLPEVRQGIKRMIEQRIGSLSELQVSWFGGEPLYGWAAIEDLGPFLAEVSEKHGVRYFSYATTNGYLLTPDKVDKLFAWKINGFQITLDGAPENHDCNRPARDGSGTFWTIFENLKSMAKRSDPFFVSLRVNIDPTNVGRMNEMLDLASHEFQGDPRFRLDFHPVGRWGGQNDEQLEVCGVDEQARLLLKLHEAAHERGLRVRNLQTAHKMGGQVCYAARPYSFLIGASGQVMKCTVVLDKDDHNIVGHITPEGSLVLNQDRMALWTEPSFQRDEQCQKCAVLPSCQGISCPVPRIHEDRRPCIPTRKLAKTLLVKAVEQMPSQTQVRKIPSSD